MASPINLPVSISINTGASRKLDFLEGRLRNSSTALTNRSSSQTGWNSAAKSAVHRHGVVLYSCVRGIKTRCQGASGIIYAASLTRYRTSCVPHRPRRASSSTSEPTRAVPMCGRPRLLRYRANIDSQLRSTPWRQPAQITQLHRRNPNIGRVPLRRSIASPPASCGAVFFVPGIRFFASSGLTRRASKPAACNSSTTNTHPQGASTGTGIPLGKVVK